MINITSIVSLIFLEIILSIDNLIFISTLVTNSASKYKKHIKYIGVGLALLIRIGLLFGITKIFLIKKPFFHLWSIEITYKEFLFIIGGLFLIYKAGSEVISMMRKKSKTIDSQKTIVDQEKSEFKKFVISVAQIIFVDLIFSLDSVIIAVALVPDMKIIILAMVVSMATLLISVDFLTQMLMRYQGLKLLAMLFIVALGIIFVLNGFGIFINKNYLHAALFFGLIFEICDIVRVKNLNEKD